MIDLPVAIKESAVNSKRIFLSASPLVLISAVSIQLQDGIQAIGNTCQISSFKKPLSPENSTDQNIFLCGDVSFKEIPSFLRGLEFQQNLADDFNPVYDASWMIVRVTQDKTGDYIFDTLFFQDIDQTGLNILHSSWCEPETAESRFSKSKTFKIEQSKEHHQINNSRIVDNNSDFEFIN